MRIYEVTGLKKLLKGDGKKQAIIGLENVSRMLGELSSKKAITDVLSCRSDTMKIVDYGKPKKMGLLGIDIKKHIMCPPI